jgi:hypothetical protein
MLSVSPPEFRRHRRHRAKRKTGPPGPVALTLVSASFDSGTHFLTLTFDRAIDIGEVATDQIAVADGANTTQYVGDPDGAGAGDATMTLLMDATGAAAGGQVLLTASADTNIVAVDDGGTWDGVTGLVLPFP